MCLLGIIYKSTYCFCASPQTVKLCLFSMSALCISSNPSREFP